VSRSNDYTTLKLKSFSAFNPQPKPPEKKYPYEAAHGPKEEFAH
jgi:hypothetical protein|tara:strand:- start:30 stop:161 length:132 start_codon:yes stop_codon:yes gene_type:complete